MTVIIDVFRAFSFECYLIRANAEKIIPVASKELAYELKRQNPTFLLAGERGGVQLPGFDFGNSPSQVESADLTGKTIVHTTSAGTQGLENALGADEILTGSLVNAKAIASYIKKGCFGEVSLVCMGEDGVREAPEDDLCARYIKGLLEGNPPDMGAALVELKCAAGGKFFDKTNTTFPEKDYYLCTVPDIFNFALRYERGENGLGCIKRIDI